MSQNQTRLPGGRVGRGASPRRPPQLFWPVVLIAVGVVLLLTNMGLLPEPAWGILWRLWPLVLIALGVDLLIGRRSVAGAVISALVALALLGMAFGLVFYGRAIPALSGLAHQETWQTSHIEYPVEGIERADVEIHWTSVPGRLEALTGGDNLIEGDVAYLGQLTFEVTEANGRASVRLDRRFTGPWGWPWTSHAADARWDVGLSRDVPLGLLLDASAGQCTFDLTGLQISSLTIDASSGAIDLRLPATGSFEARIDGSAGALDITVPAAVGLRVELDAGIGAFDPGERLSLVSGETRGDGVWETAGFDSAEHQIVLGVDQSSGAIAIR